MTVFTSQRFTAEGIRITLINDVMNSVFNYMDYIDFVKIFLRLLRTLTYITAAH